MNIHCDALLSSGVMFYLCTNRLALKNKMLSIFYEVT